MLQALFERWPESGAMKITMELAAAAEQENSGRQFAPNSASATEGERRRDSNESEAAALGGGIQLKYLGNNFFSLPDHTVLIINEVWI